MRGSKEEQFAQFQSKRTLKYIKRRVETYDSGQDREKHTAKRKFWHYEMRPTNTQQCVLCFPIYDITWTSLFLIANGENFGVAEFICQRRGLLGGGIPSEEGGIPRNATGNSVEYISSAMGKAARHCRYI